MVFVFLVGGNKSTQEADIKRLIPWQSRNLRWLMLQKVIKMTVKVFSYNPVSEMTDSEILDYLENCYKDSYNDHDHLSTYARALQFVCEIKGIKETLKYNKKVESIILSEFEKVSNSALTKYKLA